MRLRILSTIQLAREKRPAGSFVELDDEQEAARLISTGVAEAAPEDADDGLLTDEQRTFATLSAKDAIAQIETVTSLDQLSLLAVVEERRRDGPRKTVTEAFVARAAALRTPS